MQWTEKPSDKKDTNPKDAVGIRKSPMSTVPIMVIAELGNAMLEGARKYGRHNYRVAGIRASVYYDAALRHIMRWWELGEDVDPDSGLHHIVKAIACLVVLRDGMLVGNWNDDRPPTLPVEIWDRIQKEAGDIIARYPESVEAFTEKTKGPLSGPSE